MVSKTNPNAFDPAQKVLDNDRFRTADRVRYCSQILDILDRAYDGASRIKVLCAECGSIQLHPNVVIASSRVDV